MFFKFFPQVSDSLSLLLYSLHVRLLRASIKINQSINQSINQPTIFLSFDIWALWCSVLSARVPECQKLKMMDYTSMAKCKALTGSAVKGLRRLPSVVSYVSPPPSGI